MKEAKLEGARELYARIHGRLSGLREDLLRAMELAELAGEEEQHKLEIELVLLDDIIEEVSRAQMEYYLQLRGV